MDRGRGNRPDYGGGRGYGNRGPPSAYAGPRPGPPGGYSRGAYDPSGCFRPPPTGYGDSYNRPRAPRPYYDQGSSGPRPSFEQRPYAPRGDFQSRGGFDQRASGPRGDFQSRGFEPRSSGPRGDFQPRSAGPRGDFQHRGAYGRGGPRSDFRGGSRPTRPSGPAQIEKIYDGLAKTLEKKASLKDVKLPLCPAAGRKGRKVTIGVNCFDIAFGDREVYVYSLYPLRVCRAGQDGEIVALNMGPGEQRKQLEQVVQTLPKSIIYDGGHILFSPDPLPGFDVREKEVEGFPLVDPLNKDTLYLDYRMTASGKVTTRDVAAYIKDPKASALEMPQDCLRLFDCIIKMLCKEGMLTLGKSALYYQEPERLDSRNQMLLTIHSGFITTCRPQWKLRLNVDMTCKAFFPRGPLLSILANKFDTYRYNKQLESAIVKVKCLTERFYGKGDNKYARRYTIQSLCEVSARTARLDDKENITVEQYYKKMYNKTLKHPNMLLVKCSTTKSLLLPMELLTVVAFQAPVAPKSDVASAAIRIAAVPSQKRFQIVESFIKDCMQKNPVIRDKFGIELNCQATRIQARELPPPAAEFNRAPLNLDPGKWRVDAFYKSCKDGSQIKWAALHVHGPQPLVEISDIAQQLISEASRYQIRFGEPLTANCTPFDLDDHFDKFVKRGVQFVLLVLDFKIKAYPEIKRLSDITTGIPTQCVKNTTLEKRGVWPNLLLKINGKLGGINWRIPSLINAKKGAIMVMGADVTHPAPSGMDDALPESIAAITGSCSQDLMRYSVVVKSQKTHCLDQSIAEVITKMEIPVKELILKSAAANGDLPEKIVFYRDGVSEGQFMQVIIEEVGAIQKACRGIRPDYEPMITYIVVQKRHHIRFNPSDNSRNVAPGTVVDTDVTHPNDFDFYLCSHEGIQGTSKPAHYHVLYDDNDWDADSLQLFTYYLCHTYMRCARSVSIPAPTYYAHLAAYRARDWLSKKSVKELTNKHMFKVHHNQQEAMFFL